MRLLWINREGGATSLEAEAENLILGRQAGRGLTVDDGTVSREHARIFLRGGTYQVADLNSSNGTFVNGRRITRSELRPGDVLKLGSVELRFEPDALEPEAPEAPPAAPSQTPPRPPPPPPETRESGPAARTVSLRSQPTAANAGRRSAGLMRQDLAQQPFWKQALLVLVALAFATLLFVLAQRMTENVVPEAGFQEDGVDPGEDR